MTKTWYIEGDSGQRHGPYADYEDCEADANRMDGRIIEGDCDDEDDCDEDDFDDCDDVPASAECPNCHKSIHGCDGHGMLCLCGCRMVGVERCECENGITCDACNEALRNFRSAGRRASDLAVEALRRVRAAIRCNYDPAIIAREYGAEIDAALGGPDDRGPLKNHPADG